MLISLFQFFATCLVLPGLISPRADGYCTGKHMKLGPVWCHRKRFSVACGWCCFIFSNDIIIIIIFIIIIIIIIIIIYYYCVITIIL